MYGEVAGMGGTMSYPYRRTWPIVEYPEATVNPWDADTSELHSAKGGLNQRQ